jgi:hypothetical protein
MNVGESKGSPDVFRVTILGTGEGKNVKLSLCLTKHYAMKVCGGVDV